MTGEILSSILVADINITNWSVRSSSRRGGVKGEIGGSLFKPATRVHKNKSNTILHTFSVIFIATFCEYEYYADVIKCGSEGTPLLSQLAFSFRDL